MSSRSNASRPALSSSASSLTKCIWKGLVWRAFFSSADDADDVAAAADSSAGAIVFSSASNSAGSVMPASAISSFFMSEFRSMFQLSTPRIANGLLLDVKYTMLRTSCDFRRNCDGRAKAARRLRRYTADGFPLGGCMRSQQPPPLVLLGTRPSVFAPPSRGRREYF